MFLDPSCLSFFACVIHEAVIILNILTSVPDQPSTEFDQLLKPFHYLGVCLCMSLCLFLSLLPVCMSALGVAYHSVAPSSRKRSFGRVTGTQATCCRDRRPVDELIQTAGTYNPRGGGGGGGTGGDGGGPPPPPFALPPGFTTIL